MVYNSIVETIGKTPLVKLNNLKESLGLKGNVFVKVESFNPGGSVKDRISKAMIDAAIESGHLKHDTTIYEPTSGNTGIGAALVGAALGYKVVIVMPDTASIERRQIMKAYGAEVILTPGADGMKGAIAKVESLMSSDDNSITLAQFDNKVNPSIHFKTTGPEIYEDLKGDVDAFVAGVGTGGTITGTSQYLKSKNSSLKVFAVEPEDSAVLSGEDAGKHKIQGIGAGFIPTVLDQDIYDEILKVSNDDAMKTARLLASKEGIFAGISSGAALHAALNLAMKDEFLDKNIVVILPDTGERYLSTEVYL